MEDVEIKARTEAESGGGIGIGKRVEIRSKNSYLTSNMNSLHAKNSCLVHHDENGLHYCAQFAVSIFL